MGRLAYLFFTLLLLSVSGLSPVSLAGQALSAGWPLLSFHALAQHAPQSIICSITYSATQTEKGVKQAPLCGSKKDIRSLKGTKNGGLSKADDDASFFEDTDGAIYIPRPFPLGNKLDDILNQLGTLLSKNRNIMLIIGLDVDGTILQNLNNPFAIYTPDNADNVDNQKLILKKISRFLEKNDNVYLFYNTSRVSLNYEHSDPRNSNCLKNPMSHCIPFSWQRNKIIDRSEMNPETVYELPLADAILTRGGGFIDLRVRTIRHQRALKEVNNALDHWWYQDTSNLYPHLRVEVETLDGYSINGRRTMLPVIIELKRGTADAPFLSIPGFPMIQSIPLRDKTEGRITQYGFNGVALNKGTLSRLLLALVQKEILKGRKGLFVAAGDAFADIPMINPLLEAEGLGPVREDQREVLNHRLRHNITRTEIPELSEHSSYLKEGNLIWLTGVMICHEDFVNPCNTSNPSIDQALSDKRVVKVEGSGLAVTVEVFNKIARAFETYLKEHEPQIPD